MRLACGAPKERVVRGTRFVAAHLKRFRLTISKAYMAPRGWLTELEMNEDEPFSSGFLSAVGERPYVCDKSLGPRVNIAAVMACCDV